MNLNVAVAGWGFLFRNLKFRACACVPPWLMLSPLFSLFMFTFLTQGNEYYFVLSFHGNKGNA